MFVIIDGYKRIVKKDNGEVKTIVQCSTAEDSKIKDHYGREHLTDTWLDGIYDFKCGEIYQTEEETRLFNGKIQLVIVGFKEV